MADRDTYTKRDIAEEVRAKYRLTHEASRDLVDFVLDSIQSALEEGLRVEIRGFGSFDFKQRRPRIGRNPLYPERGDFEVPACTVLKFRPSKELAEKIKQT